MPLSHSQTFEGFELEGAGGSLPTIHHKRKFEYSGEDGPHAMSNSGDFWSESSVSLPKRKCLRSDLSSQESQCQQMSQDEDLPGCLKDSATFSSTSPSVLLSSSFLSSSLPKTVTSPLPRNLAKNNLADHFLSCMQQREKEEELKFNNNSVYIQTQGGPEKMLFENQESAKALRTGIHIDNLGSRFNTMEDSGESGDMNDTNNEMMDESTLMESDYVPDISQYSPSTVSSNHRSRSITPPRDVNRNEERRCGFLSCRGIRPSPVSGRLYCHCSASWRGMYGIDNGYITDYY